MTSTPIVLTLPPWIDELVGDPDRVYPDPRERLRLAVELARWNVERGTGGPFGAAVFDLSTFRLIAPGVNRVMPESCSVAHAEIMALMLAQKRLGCFDLSAPGLPSCELAASAEPCAMCYGALTWSGVRRLAFGALGEDVTAIGFDEGYKPADWAAALAARGIEVAAGLLREEARAVLQDYHRNGGMIYNTGCLGGST
jgi:tRNA(Arg) A34 adenosine deaminase TadA